MDYGPPIYQAYVDAVKANMQRNEMKLELGLHALEATQGIINIQNQIQERQAIAQAYAQQGQADQQGQAGTNPATGGQNTDPAEKTAQVYDRIAQNIGRFNPKLALEYSTKASTLRDQALTRTKNRIDIAQKQTDVVGKIFSSIKPGDQEGYTQALQQASDQGVDISKLGLTGNVVTDMPTLERIARGTLSYKDVLEEHHRAVTENQADLNYQEKVRYDSARIGAENSKIGLAEQRLSLDKQFKEDELHYRSRADARAQAGLERTDAMDLSKSKDFAGRPGKGDKPYVDAVIASDPDLALLPDNVKQNVAQQLAMGARSKLSKSVTKPGQSVTADDFTKAVDSLVPMVKKNLTPGAKGGFLGIGAKESKLNAPLPPAIDTKEEFNKLPVGGQFRKGDSMYKKTGPNQYEEIK